MNGNRKSEKYEQKEEGRRRRIVNRISIKIKKRRKIIREKTIWTQTKKRKQFKSGEIDVEKVELKEGKKTKEKIEEINERKRNIYEKK